jgi:hypothetical protein
MARRLVLLSLACSWSAACAAELRPPSLEVRPLAVEGRAPGGGFCPPGQAKKGRC